MGEATCSCFEVVGVAAEQLLKQGLFIGGKERVFNWWLILSDRSEIMTGGGGRQLSANRSFPNYAGCHPVLLC